MDLLQEFIESQALIGEDADDIEDSFDEAGIVQVQQEEKGVNNRSGQHLGVPLGLNGEEEILSAVSRKKYGFQVVINSILQDISSLSLPRTRHFSDITFITHTNWTYFGHTNLFHGKIIHQIKYQIKNGNEFSMTFYDIKASSLCVQAIVILPAQMFAHFEHFFLSKWVSRREMLLLMLLNGNSPCPCLLRAIFH